MGKVGRIACIFTPWALTLASFICLILIEIAGWSQGSTLLNSLYFFEANFTGLSISGASSLANTTTLTLALEEAKSSNALADIYQVHLWNYCTSNTTNGTIDFCSGRHANYIFNPVEVWNLNSTSATTGTSTSSGDNPIASAEARLKNNTEALENEVLGKSGREALDAYTAVAKWMFIAYEISFWTTLATLVCSIFAIFSRWGSFLTWIFSITSSIFTLAAVLTSTILFGVLVGSLETILHPYGVKLSVGGHALAVTWLAVLFSWAATLFWFFSVCCCSGRSNPHHKSNRGGLWNAEPKGGYGDYGRGRGLRVEKTGGYERVGSPYVGASDQVPLQQYPAQPAGHSRARSGAFEPYRHA